MLMGSLLLEGRMPEEIQATNVGISKCSSIVIFGASGDLTRRKLIPALYNLYRKGRLWETTRIVGLPEDRIQRKHSARCCWKG